MNSARPDDVTVPSVLFAGKVHVHWGEERGDHIRWTCLPMVHRDS
jgi:hypothetical protein